MRQLTEDGIREAFANANDDDLRLLTLPLDFLLTDWDHLDFLAWRDPRTKGRGYLVAELGRRAHRGRAPSRRRHLPRGVGAVQRLPHDAAGRSGVAVLGAQGGRRGTARRHASAPTSARICRAMRMCAWPRRSRPTRSARASTRGSTERDGAPRPSSSEYWKLRGRTYEQSGRGHRRRADRRAARRQRSARVRRGSGAERRGRADPARASRRR